MEKTIEIPFGAKDSELKGWEYTIPEGMEAEIKDGKVIVREKESEDERIRKDLITFICQFAPEHLKTEYVSYLEKQKEQKPTEWSEEDEGMLNCIIATLCEESHGGRETNDKIVTWLENRLKSLRPHSHWKPSEEQIDALEHFIRSWGESGTMSPQNTILCAAKSLYTDLKKLL